MLIFFANLTRAGSATRRAHLRVFTYVHLHALAGAALYEASKAARSDVKVFDNEPTFGAAVLGVGTRSACACHPRGRGAAEGDALLATAAAPDAKRARRW